MSWDRYRYRVASTRDATPVIRELWLEPLDRALPFVAGQYALLGDTTYRVPQRSYSIANAPRSDGRVSVLVTRVAGGATSSWAHGLATGDEVALEGPFGTFVLAPVHDGPVLLLGAGSGLAPVRALAELLIHESARPVTLFFSGRTAADAIDRDRFEAWQRGHSRFNYLLTLTRDPTAPLHERIPVLLARRFDRLAGWDVFAAGPSGFVTGCAAVAQSLGAAPADVHTEEFFVDPQPWSGEAPRAPIGA